MRFPLSHFSRLNMPRPSLCCSRLLIIFVVLRWTLSRTPLSFALGSPELDTAHQTWPPVTKLPSPTSSLCVRNPPTPRPCPVLPGPAWLPPRPACTSLQCLRKRRVPGSGSYLSCGTAGATASFKILPAVLCCALPNPQTLFISQLQRGTEEKHGHSLLIAGRRGMISSICGQAPYEQLRPAKAPVLRAALTCRWERRQPRQRHVSE